MVVPKLAQTLQKLASTLTVKDLMVPTESSRVQSAKKMLRRYLPNMVTSMSFQSRIGAGRSRATMNVTRKRRSSSRQPI